MDTQHRSARLRRALAVTLGAVLAAWTVAPRLASAQRRLVVNADEWTLGNGNIVAAPDNGDVFARNVRNWLTGGAAGNVLAYSSNFGLNGSTLASVMSTNGYTWTQVDPGTAAGNTAWANRNSYRAIFLGGNEVPSLTDLIDYVNGGGSVYLMGGTGFSLPGGEDTYWDPLLARFGLDFGTSYNGIGGDIATSGFAAQGPFGAALFTGVSNLYQNNGNSVLNAGALPSNVTRQIFIAQQNGLFGAAAIAPSVTTPEPATYVLLSTGLVAIGAVVRRRRA